MKVRYYIEESSRYHFDRGQVAKLSGVLQKIIAVEKDARVKARFMNMDGLLRGRYPTRSSLQKAALGVLKMMKELESSELGEARRTPLHVAITLCCALLASCANVGLGSMGGDPVLGKYSAMNADERDEVFEIRLPENVAEAAYEGLTAYLKSQDVSYFNSERIEPTARASMTPGTVS